MDALPIRSTTSSAEAQATSTIPTAQEALPSTGGSSTVPTPESLPVTSDSNAAAAQEALPVTSDSSTTTAQEALPVTSTPSTTQPQEALPVASDSSTTTAQKALPVASTSSTTQEQETLPSAPCATFVPETSQPTSASSSTQVEDVKVPEKAKNLSFVLHEPYKVKYEDTPVPELRSSQDVLVRICWTGICGSDVHYYTNGRIGDFVLTSPMILGHESSGTIAAIGSGVTTFKVGDRVCLEPGVPCRRCPRCKSGFYNLCPDMAFASTPPFDGTLTKYYAIPADFCVPLPSHVSLEEGALIEPTAVAVHIVKQAAVRPGSTVVVFGAGPVGLLCSAVAGAFGASKVVVVDIQEKRLAFAKGWVKSAPVSTYLPSADLDADGNAKKLLTESGLDVDGVDVVIDASGAAASVATGLSVVRTGGTYVQGGMGRPDIPFPILKVCIKEVTVKGSFRYGSGDYKLAVALVSAGKVDVRGLISQKVAFGEAEKAFEAVRKGEGIKMLIEGVLD